MMQIRDSDQILEIGCGSGIMAELICKRLTSGRLTAIDRSSAMIRKAGTRNSEFIEEGRARFIQTDCENFNPGKTRFTKIAAFNVNMFLKDYFTGQENLA